MCTETIFQKKMIGKSGTVFPVCKAQHPAYTRQWESPTHMCIQHVLSCVIASGRLLRTLAREWEWKRQITVQDYENNWPCRPSERVMEIPQVPILWELLSGTCWSGKTIYLILIIFQKENKQIPFVTTPSFLSEDRGSLFYLPGTVPSSDQNIHRCIISYSKKQPRGRQKLCILCCLAR